MSKDNKNKIIKANSSGIALLPLGWQKDKKLAERTVAYANKTLAGKLALKTLELIKKKK